MNVDWKEFGAKLWNKGVHAALEVIVADTSNPFDNVALDLVDQLADRLLGKGE